MEWIVVDRRWAPLKIRILTVAKFQQISRLKFERKGRENGVVQLSFVCKFACTFSIGQVSTRVFEERACVCVCVYKSLRFRGGREEHIEGRLFGE